MNDGKDEMQFIEKESRTFEASSSSSCLGQQQESRLTTTTTNNKTTSMTSSSSSSSSFSHPFVRKVSRKEHKTEEMFQQEQDKSAFSLSGRWQNVQLGLIRERSLPWLREANQSLEPRRPTNEVKMRPKKANNNNNNNMSKARSSGCIVDDCEAEIQFTGKRQSGVYRMSGIGAWEERDDGGDGRKSVEVFLQEQTHHHHHHPITPTKLQGEQDPVTTCEKIELVDESANNYVELQSNNDPISSNMNNDESRSQCPKQDVTQEALQNSSNDVEMKSPSPAKLEEKLLSPRGAFQSIEPPYILSSPSPFKPDMNDDSTQCSSNIQRESPVLNMAEYPSNVLHESVETTMTQVKLEENSLSPREAFQFNESPCTLSSPSPIKPDMNDDSTQLVLNIQRKSPAQNITEYPSNVHHASVETPMTPVKSVEEVLRSPVQNSLIVNEAKLIATSRFTPDTSSMTSTPSPSQRRRVKQIPSGSRIEEDIQKRAEELELKEAALKRMMDERKKREEDFQRLSRKTLPKVLKSVEKKKERDLDPKHKVAEQRISTPENEQKKEEFEERLKQIEADLQRQKVEEQRRLKEIEADRLRQLEEEEAKTFSTSRGNGNVETENLDPMAVKKCIEKKLKDQRMREERRQRTLKGEAFKMKALHSSTNVNNNNDKSFGEALPQPPPPPPPPRDPNREAKVVAANKDLEQQRRAHFPSQQERWRMKMKAESEEKERKLKERNGRRKREEEEEEKTALTRKNTPAAEAADVKNGRTPILPVAIAEPAAPTITPHPPPVPPPPVPERRTLATPNIQPPPPPPQIHEERKSSSNNDGEQTKAERKKQESGKSPRQARKIIKAEEAEKQLPLILDACFTTEMPNAVDLEQRRAEEAERLKEWEKLKRLEAEEEERMIRQMEAEMCVKREEAPPKTQEERNWEEILMQREEEEQLERIHMERELQRQRSLSGGKSDIKRRKTAEQSAKCKTASNNTTATTTNGCSNNDTNLPQAQKAESPVNPRMEDDWEAIKRRQEEEEQRQLFELERQMILERQQKQPLSKTESGPPRFGPPVKNGFSSSYNKQRSLDVTRTIIDEEEDEAKMEEEMRKLAEVERKKKEVEEELEKERLHLESLQRMTDPTELMMIDGKKGAASAHEEQRLLELERIKELKELEIRKKEELARISMEKEVDNIREAAGAVKNVAKTLMQINNNATTNGNAVAAPVRPVSAGSDEDVFGAGGYSEAEISIGFDLPNQERSSGDITPSPTTGELSDLSQPSGGHHQQLIATPPTTPLKSLLKKPSLDDEEVGLDDEDDDKMRKVHFSETNQVKVLSQESLISTSTAAGATETTDSCKTKMTTPGEHYQLMN